MLTQPTYCKKKNMHLTSNITSLVKKYAAYIFKELKLDKNKEEMNEEQFCMILRSHQKIFHIYFEGFHSYIWQFDDDGLPFNQKISPWI